MSLRKFLNETASGTLSEIGFYTPLATHIFGALLGYPPAHRDINKSGKHGVPDIRLHSQEDASEWAVVEAKIQDQEIRDNTKRASIWHDQILEHGYISPETFYVVLCAPRTLYVCDLDGQLLETLHIEADHLTDPRSGATYPLTDTAFRERMRCISYAASLERGQFEAFREGRLKSGHIPLSAETLPQLRVVFEYAIEKLKEYCRFRFRQLRAEFGECGERIAEIDRTLADIGSGPVKRREKLVYRRLTIRAEHRVAFQLFEDDYNRFKHDQTYAGTQKDEHFEDIFCTNTAYVALSRLFFVRICEDAGLTTRKISNSGVRVWREFVANIKDHYQDLLDVAFEDIRHIYLSLFEPTVFDWFGKGDGRLHDILERVLFRLNAFGFRDINRDLLGAIYQSFRPRIERRRLGEYYTPDEVVDFILAQTGICADPAIMQKRILDPSCGSFTFGVRAIQPLLKAGAHLTPQNKIDLVRTCLRGQDINPFSVFLSHLSILFALLDIYLEAKRSDPRFEIQSFNVKNRNSLTYGVPAPDEEGAGEEPPELAEEIERVDYVVGNPPFVRNERIPSGDRAVLGKLYASLRAGNTDLASYFLYAAFNYWMKPGGTLGMVAPLSVANARMAAELRRFLNAFEMTAVVSLEWLRLRKEIFKGVDIVPMLIFGRGNPAVTPHRIQAITGLEKRQDLARFVADAAYADAHSSAIDFHKWYSLSPTGDWPVEITTTDVAILEKLKSQDKLSSAGRSSYGIKLGANADATSPYSREEINEQTLPFIKGQNICSFYCDPETQELLHLDGLGTASDPALWGDLDFYRMNEGKYDEDGLGRKDLRHDGLRAMNGPTDTRCCAWPEVYRTVSAGWFSPLECAIHNSGCLLVPTKYSAPVTAAIVNSRAARYYAFLMLRSGVVQRAHSHFYPRTIESLPFPRPTTRQVRKLHKLAIEASELSARAAMTVTDIYLESVGKVERLTKAGFLGLRLAEGLEEVDREELVPPDEPQIPLDFKLFAAEDPDLELLARVALLATENDGFSAQEIENILLPAEAPVRKQLAERVRNYAADLKRTQDRVLAAMEEIDEIVAKGLSLSPAEHDTIRKRCHEFPLSITVERPRFAWNPERKVQARRTYGYGERFRA
jgi:type I restriction-modification system DNA methylase subunit